MANIFSKFVGLFKMTDDMDEDYDDEDIVSENLFSHREKEGKRRKMRTEVEEYQPSVFSHSKKRVQEEKNNKIIPFKKTSGSAAHQVSILSPKNIKEACKACDYLAEGKAVVLNLEGIPEAEAQRIMDFVFGSMYAINGEYSQISSYIFIFVSQSGELLSDLEESVKSFSVDSFSSQAGEFEIPIIRREF